MSTASRGEHGRAHQRRMFEIGGIVVTTVLLVVISRLETRLFELSERLSANRDFFISVVYFGLINLNVVLILVLGFLIFRNIVKLVLERRRGVLGSRLRTKLVVTLVFFAVAPTTLLFYISSRFITTSFDTWFSVKVRDTMQQTREAGTLVYKQDQRRLESLARIALQRIELNRSEIDYPGALPVPKPRRLEGFETEYRLDGIKVFDRGSRLIWSSNAADSMGSVAAENSFVTQAIQFFLADPSLVSKGTVEADDKRDLVRGAAPIYDPNSAQLVGILVTEEHFETQILRSIEAILTEFANLRPGAQLIRLSYMVLLAVMVLIIVFSATWLGFYVARGITGPIQSLAEATREVALGNYSITLAAPTDDETGQLVRSFNSMTRDLRSHKEQVEASQSKLRDTNEELDRRRQYMEVVLKNITAGVVSVDAQGNITSFNHAAERLLHVNAAKAIGKHVRQGLGNDLWSELWQPVEERMPSQVNFSGQIELNLQGKTVTLLTDACRMRDEHGNDVGIVLVFDDATEQVKLQKVAAWREVARRIAHEIKNPITPIKLSAQRLLRRFGDQFEGDDGAVFKSCIETILVQVDSLRDLVNEFSKFSRLPAINPTSQNINDLLLDVAEFYRMSYPDTTFDLSGLGKDLPKLALDKEQMNRVFVNVISNALAAVEKTGRPGVIAISTTNMPELKAVRVEVADNGTGIPSKIKETVFEPYFSTKTEGTGLGLSIVTQIVGDHGGYVRLADRAPYGTSVIIDLPVVSAV